MRIRTGARSEQVGSGLSGVDDDFASIDTLELTLQEALEVSGGGSNVQHGNPGGGPASYNVHTSTGPGPAWYNMT